MPKKFKHIIAALALLLAFYLKPANGQDIDVGVFVGGSYYLGELNPGRQFLFTRPAYGGLVRFNINERFAIRGQLLRGEAGR
jgi:hypothetical protein